MTNLEKYKDEIKSGIKKGDALKCVISDIALKYGGKGNEHKCDYDLCSKCVLESVDWLCEEFHDPIKLKQWEYDVLKAVKSHNQSAYRFNNSSILKQLVNKGHFKNVDDTRDEIKHAIIQDVLDNCKIVADDYEGFEDTK